MEVHRQGGAVDLLLSGSQEIPSCYGDVQFDGGLCLVTGDGRHPQRAHLVGCVDLRVGRIVKDEGPSDLTAKIESVDIQDAIAERLDDRPLAYAIKGNWAAQGTVGHWGHVHTRRNRYEAIVTVEAVDGAWKITDLEVLEEQRVDPAFGSVADTASAKPMAQGSEAQ